MQNANYSEWKATVRDGCDFAILVAGALATALAIFFKQDESALSEWPSALQPMVSWLFENNWWIIVALMGVAAAIKIVKERLDRTWVWSAVQAIVDRIQAEAFGDQGGYTHHHRATLFRYQKYLWWPFPVRHFAWPWGLGRGPGSGWLLPVIRSGHATQRTATYFLAPDDADKAEGVVGHIWNSNKEIGLSVGAPLQQGATAEEISEYAGKTFVDATRATKELSKKVLAASFRGVPIEGKAGRKWGVLILDSRHPEAAMNAKLNIDPYAYCLGKLLERV
jgi:hypothetical protein